MKHTVLGLLGTALSFAAENANHIAGTIAGLFTAAWMARQLWLSFKKK